MTAKQNTFPLQSGGPLPCAVLTDQGNSKLSLYERIVETTSDGVWLIDGANITTFVNRSMASMLGLEQHHLIGTSILESELIHPEDRDLTKAALARDRAVLLPRRAEVRLRHRDGSWRTLSFSTQDLCAHQAGALLLQVRDVTEERKLEEDMEHSRRLESIGRLAGGIAHDFNNLLTTILSATEFLAGDQQLSETARSDVREIKRASHRAAELTNQLLAFARKRMIRPQPIGLEQIIVKQERFLRRVIGEQIALRTIIGDNVWPVFGDPAQLEQVIINLAVNARDAMKRGGQLTFELENVTVDEQFAQTHAGVRPGPYVLLSVSDTGDGIPSQVIPHIFEPFFTTKSVGKGSGLGLATVYGIVRQSGGHVWVYSEPQIGTTFQLYFPRWVGEVIVATTSIPPSFHGGTESVLVVEDDASVREMLVRALTQAGYAVQSASSGHEGLALATSLGGEFDLLITDVIMEGMTGKELAARLTKACPRLRVLFVSGYSEDKITRGGVLEEGVEFLAKPFSPLQVCARVRALLDPQ